MTQAPTARPPENPPVKSGKVVKYIGTADVREIDARSWSSVGAKDQKKVVWSRKNKWTVPVSELSDEAVRYCDEDDSGFAVVDADTK